MIARDRLLTIDDVSELMQLPEYENRKLELIDGRLQVTMDPSLRQHGLLAMQIGFHLEHFNKAHDLGEVAVESGHHPPYADHTLLGPDVAFTRHQRLRGLRLDRYYPVMPDLAVEIMSRNDRLSKARDKAERYLRDGSTVVWIVQPKRRGVRVCRLLQDSSLAREFVGEGESLVAQDILPGFALPVAELFKVKRD